LSLSWITEVHLFIICSLSVVCYSCAVLCVCVVCVVCYSRKWTWLSSLVQKPEPAWAEPLPRPAAAASSSGNTHTHTHVYTYTVHTWATNNFIFLVSFNLSFNLTFVSCQLFELYFMIFLIIYCKLPFL